MFKVKHFLEPLESDDGHRFWVEPFGVTRDLRDMCHIDQIMDHVAPPKALWEWFENHPQGYEYFRARYHSSLESGPHRQALEQLVHLAHHGNVTLLHQGDNPNENSASALHEFLSELRAYIKE
ncbi:MAG TPA: DUF488 family protein [Tepidisphaeraceae bacterium]|jgi:uncharacterized protein YeaO (DUF488 family)|nr:DUF488 family protein [Tepidisphaeraceae bacterium]